MDENLNPDNKRFLDLLPQNTRGTVANSFLEPIRNGVKSPAAIVRFVDADAVKQTQYRWATPERTEKAESLRTLLREHNIDALALAAYYVAYEALPRSERERIKAGNAQVFVQASMEGKPVTDAQKVMLEKLGFTGAWPCDRKAASQKIDQLMHGQKAGAPVE